ncbi:MAG: NADH:ubiquinone reductase (Na(+)-transporting) subunit C [Bacteroidetes bacterium]|nr:MAG: NADH:ubiquinone reductase (Na(+)-transporting) subunit C [Bacteroidota bacterium]
MKKDSNVYIFLYSVVLVVVVAVLLAVASTALRPAQERNIEMEKRLDILKAIGVEGEVDALPMSRQGAVSKLYDKFITERLAVNGEGDILEGQDAFAIDLRPELKLGAAEQKLPVFVAHLSDGSTKYVFPLAGQGLWGPIWGYISLDEDMDHIYGVSFGHKGETPGLGAEIVSGWFRGQFKGKEIFSGSSFVSVSVLKGAGASEGNPNAIDGISGGTLTSQGVEKMLMDCLSAYKPFIEKVKAGGVPVAASVEDGRASGEKAEEVEAASQEKELNTSEDAPAGETPEAQMQKEEKNNG